MATAFEEFIVKGEGYQGDGVPWGMGVGTKMPSHPRFSLLLLCTSSSVHLHYANPCPHMLLCSVPLYLCRCFSHFFQIPAPFSEDLSDSSHGVVLSFSGSTAFLVWSWDGGGSILLSMQPNKKGTCFSIFLFCPFSWLLKHSTVLHPCCLPRGYILCIWESYCLG